jgi:hypothetical protein
MYHKIKTRLFFILLFGSFTSYGQIGYSSLVNICAEQFNNDKYIYPYRECKGCKVDVRKEIEDTFGRYILLGAYNLDSVDFDIESTGLNSPYVFKFTAEYFLYIIDIYSGEIVSVENIDKFNVIMNTAKQKLSNLDKCTLYLLLNKFGVYGFSDLARGYPKSIKQSKKFTNLHFTFWGNRYSKFENPEWLCSKIKFDKDQSNNNNIFIYEFLSDTSEYLACRYQFLFDSTDNISRINKEYLKRRE